MYATMCKLQKELFANAKTIPSMLGGGHNHHLALIMTDAEYLVISAVNYDKPIHPGAQPVHQANATTAQITEANRQYDAALLQVALHVSVVNVLRQQILCAIDNKYLMALLEHPDLGYTVSPLEMLLYLKTTYRDITPAEIETNRATLCIPWNPDDDIEDLWLRISNAQMLAHHAKDKIEDPVAIRLTIGALEASGVFDFALDNWRLKDYATKTLETFKEHFNNEDKERERKLTTKTGRYHGAHGADSNHRPRTPPPSTPPTTSQHVILPSGAKMYYCWSNGLSKNPQHTSPTCNFKKDGHIDTATADNVQGGCKLIGTGPRPRRERPPPGAPHSGAPAGP
jgi:hypothetical protein